MSDGLRRRLGIFGPTDTPQPTPSDVTKSAIFDPPGQQALMDLGLGVVVGVGLNHQSIPSGAMLWSDGTPMLWSDNTYMLWSVA